MTDAAATENRTAMATITFSPSGETIEVSAGTSLLDAAILCELDVRAPCAGQGRCGRCLVRVKSGTVERRSNAGLATAEILDGWAVACQTYVRGPVEVEVPERRRETVRPHGHAVAEPESLPLACDWRQDPAVRTFLLDIEPPSLADNTSDFDRLRRALSQQHGIEEVRAELPILRRLGKDLRMANWKVSVTLEMRDWVYGAYLPPRLIRIYPSAFHHASMGLAIDLGTTSVVVYLLDFATGRVIDSASAYNKQIACGDDVISRIIYAKRKRGLDRLQRLAVETINDLIVELKQRNHIEPYEIHEIAVAGNTTMTHLLLGLDPRFLREEPYIPTLSTPPKLVAGELGLRANVLARVHILPSVGSYVGGDITAGVISSGMFATDKLTLFIDIGTNGEMVLGNKDWLLACACSAGPAFEGGGVGDGMRASPGAIEDVYISDDTWEPTFLTIDDAPAVGICGSGLIDLLGELFVTGLVDKSGHLDLEAPTARIRVRDGVPEYVVCHAGEGGAERDIVLTESDITSLIRAKAAIYAGFEVLCRSVGVDLADVEQILIGGAFGQYINIEKAIRIGLLPDQPVERFKFLGNTSAQGAFAALLCVNIRHEVLDVAAKMTYLELSADNSFMDEYTSALFLPHTDLSGFPSVEAMLQKRGNGSDARRETT
ncbi:MAG TPA: ASKHA domain-containing protein [Thermoleophilia bacterium]